MDQGGIAIRVRSSGGRERNDIVYKVVVTQCSPTGGKASRETFMPGVESAVQAALAFHLRYYWCRTGLLKMTQYSQRIHLYVSPSASYHVYFRAWGGICQQSEASRMLRCNGKAIAKARTRL